MTSLHFDEFEMVTLQLSKEAYEILRKYKQTEDQLTK